METKTPLRQLPLGDFGTDDESDADLVTYISVGRAVIRWGCLEQNFNHIVAMLYARFGGKDQPPFQLSRKIRFWNECFRGKDALAHISGPALTFSRHFVEAKKQRDTLLHVHWQPSASPVVPLKGRMLRTLETGHVSENTELNLLAIDGLVTRIDRLNIGLLAIMIPLFTRRPPQR